MTVAGGPNETGYAALRTSGLGDTHLCFFSLAATTSSAEKDPFTIANDPEWIYPVWLAADAGGAPHFYLSRAPAIAHVSKGANGWVQEPVSSDALKEHTLQGVYIDPKGVASILYAAHVDQPAGYANLWSLHLATSGGASYKQDLVFDAAGKYEQPFASLANDDSGVSAVYWARSAPGQPSQVFAWRGGSAKPLFTDKQVIGHAAASASHPADQPIVSSQSVDGIHLFRRSATGDYSETVVAGTGIPNYAGCPGLNMQGCMKKTSCTETGDGAIPDHRLERTADGSVWLVYVERHVDRDFDLSESCVTQGDPFCTCNRTLHTDRSTSTLVVARVTDDPNAVPEPRLRATLGRIGDEATIATAPHGSHLQIAVGHDVAVPTVFRYLTVATDRL
jgi:hypothetical protein